MVLNYQTSQISVFKFLNVSLKGTLFGFAVKSCQNFQNTPPFFFRNLKFGFSQNLNFGLLDFGGGCRIPVMSLESSQCHRIPTIEYQN
jgi:hypothetical protein